jgi:hypothetical protein
LEIELRHWKVLEKQKFDSNHMTDLSVGASRYEGRSPSSHVSDPTTERDLHACIGGLKARVNARNTSQNYLILSQNRQIFESTIKLENYFFFKWKNRANA